MEYKMQKNIGIIGHTGRMGKLLLEVLQNNNDFKFCQGYSRHAAANSLSDVFIKSDCIIDFSSKDLIHDLLKAATNYPKPLLICTTGWQQEEVAEELQAIAAKVPVMLAANTSLGAWLQRHLVKIAANILDETYDLDLLEKHHKHKKDSPSGTAKQIIADLHTIMPQTRVAVHTIRAGNIAGEHEVSFTSNEERISITHEVFDRKIFAVGALRLAKWLLNSGRKPGLYTIDDLY
jgi:4-hydroxy-tetrahydrodipicolinate reductase